MSRPSATKEAADIGYGSTRRIAVHLQRPRHSAIEQPDHDAATVAETFEGIPTAGFFAQGELGPIGGKNFVHGFTACVALFA